MTIETLAYIALVRNHLLTVLNDKSASGRDQFRLLNTAKQQLDKKFIDLINDLDIESIGAKKLPEVLTIPKNEILPGPGQLDLGFMVATPVQEPTNSLVTASVVEPQEVRKIEALSENPNKPKVPAKDPELLAAINKQKQQLKQQGRSNKKKTQDES